MLFLPKACLADRAALPTRSGSARSRFEAERAGEVDAVDVEAHRRVGREQEVKLADTADERADLRRRAAGAAPRN